MAVSARIVCGDCLDVLKTLPAESVNTCVTSPPYYSLRDYGIDGQIGLEETPEAYVARLVEVFAEVRRVLKDDGTLWLNLGDSYAASTKTTGRNDADTRNAWHYKVGIASAPHRANDGCGQTLVRQSKHKRPRTLNGGGCASWSSREETVKVASRGLKPKDLVGIPWRVAFALQADGWYLRQDIIWHKPNPMPESVRDRCTKAHEYIFLLSKSPRYYYDADAIKEPAVCGDNGSRYDTGKTADHQLGRAQKGRRAIKFGGTKYPGVAGNATYSGNEYRPTGYRNKRDVWTVATKPYAGCHFATFPPDLIRPCVRAGCPVGGVVLDPFAGAGTTGLVALEEGRDFLGIELNPEYVGLIEKRLAPLLAVRTLDCFFEEGRGLRCFR
jgi:DNA modification methylase